MKFLVINMTLLLGVFACNQVAESDECHFLKSILREDIIQKYYHITRFDGDYIVVVDTGNYFYNCSEFLIGAHQVKRVKDNKELKDGKQLWVEIYNVEKIDTNAIKVTLGSRINGLYGYVIYSIRNSQYLLKKHQLGQI